MSWLENEQERKIHPCAGLFPPMSDQEYRLLRDDIAAHGLLEPIWIHPDGSIIDGRHRHKICLETETKPKFKTWKGDGSLVLFVLRLNGRRRDLTAGQKAAIAVGILPALEKEGKERQRLAGKLSGRGTAREGEEKLVAKMPQAIGKSRDHAAQHMAVSARYVSYAKKLSIDAPDLLQKVWVGIITITQAMRELKKRTKVPPEPIEGMYRIFYADPPWEYSDTQDVKDDGYGSAERHYPTMSLKELCEMGEQVKACSEDDAVLFLWVTSPLLEDSFKIVRAWDFKYKASFVWDKVKHNYGHYNSVRHEILLICTKGSCMPDIATLFDSVQSIERTDVHSEKPEKFREIIDALYSHGNRIELFSRREMGGWDSWGNEPKVGRANVPDVEK